MAITPNPPAEFTPGMIPPKIPNLFKFWCQTTLPAVYDDSLSYYQLLCKVVNYLNELIQQVDNDTKNISALFTAYGQLQEYVNNYFESLDVQEEINGKLDELVADGTLTSILSTLIGTDIAPVFVDSTGQMTDQTKVYVLSTNGHIYRYINGSFNDTGLVYGLPVDSFLPYPTAVTSTNYQNIGFTDITEMPANRVYIFDKGVTNDMVKGLPVFPSNANNKTIIKFNIKDQKAGSCFMAFTYENAAPLCYVAFTLSTATGDTIKWRDVTSLGEGTSVTTTNYQQLGMTNLMNAVANRVSRFTSSITSAMVSNLPIYGTSLKVFKFSAVQAMSGSSSYIAVTESSPVRLFAGYDSSDAIVWSEIQNSEVVSNDIIHTNTLPMSDSNQSSWPFDDVLKAPMNSVFSMGSSATNIIKNIPPALVNHVATLITYQATGASNLYKVWFISGYSNAGTHAYIASSNSASPTTIYWKPIAAGAFGQNITNANAESYGISDVLTMPMGYVTFGATVTEDQVKNLPAYGVEITVHKYSGTGINLRTAYFAIATGNSGTNNPAAWFGCANNDHDTLTWSEIITEHNDDNPNTICDTTFGIFKKFAVIGDSMARGQVYDYSTNAVRRVERLAWGKIVADKVGSEFVSLAAGGMSMQQFIDGFTESAGGVTVSLDMATDGAHNVPCVVIGLGLNQTLNGSAADVNPGVVGAKPVNGSFYACYAYIINRLLQYYNNNVYIICLTIPYYPGQNTANKSNAIREIVAKYGGYNVYCADIAADWNDEFSPGGYVGECWHSNHLTGAGYNAAGELTLNTINRLIMANGEAFGKADFNSNNQ